MRNWIIVQNLTRIQKKIGVKKTQKQKKNRRSYPLHWSDTKINILYIETEQRRRKKSVCAKKAYFIIIRVLDSIKPHEAKKFKQI